MAVTDLANAAAAVSAGYRKVQIDRGTAGVQDKNPAPRYATVFSKAITGAATTESGRLLEVMGESNVDAATADSDATTKLNAVRRHYYGGSPGRASGAAESASGRGGTHTVETT
jgi:hypothetical protein